MRWARRGWGAGRATGLAPGPGRSRRRPRPPGRSSALLVVLVSSSLALLIGSLPALEGRPARPAKRPAPEAAAYTNPSPPPCQEHRSVALPSGSAQRRDGSVADPAGHVFPPGTYYTTDGRTRGCACEVRDT